MISPITLSDFCVSSIYPHPWQLFSETQSLRFVRKVLILQVFLLFENCSHLRRLMNKEKKFSISLTGREAGERRPLRKKKFW
jgi:hypothetical protein